MPPSNTTINNLAEQLRWLLSTKPFIPCLTASQTPATLAQTASNAASTIAAATTIPNLWTNNAADAVEADEGSGRRQVRVEEGANALAAQDPVEGANMVRLRVFGVAGPRSDDVHSDKQRPTSSAKVMGVAGVNGRAAKKEADELRSSAETMPANNGHTGSSRSATRSPSFEMIDLTADSHNKGSLAGKKRKSNEISRTAPLRETNSKKTNLQDSFDGFEAIDDISIPQGPPPPYSHSPQRKAQANHNQPIGDRSSQAMQAELPAASHSPRVGRAQPFIDIHKPSMAIDSRDRDQHVSQSTSLSSSSDTRKRKTLERTDSEAAGRLQPSKRRIVPDSSDEFEEDELESNRNSPEIIVPSPNLAVDESTVIAPQPNHPKAALSDLTKSELAVLDMFAKWSQTDVEKELNVVDKFNASMRMQALEHFDRGEAIPPSLRAEQQYISQRRAAVESLKASLSNLQQIEERRRVLKSQLEEAFLHGTDLNDISARNVVLASELRVEGRQAMKHLRFCGLLSDAMELIRPPSKGPNTQDVIQATPVPPEAPQPSMKAVEEPIVGHQSERIEQTQHRAQDDIISIPTTKLWTPANGIRFTAGSSAAAPSYTNRPAPHIQASTSTEAARLVSRNQHSPFNVDHNRQPFHDAVADSHREPDPQYGPEIYEPDQDFEGFGDDDDILNEVGQSFEELPPTKPASTWVQPRRSALQEVPGNARFRGPSPDNCIVKSTAVSQPAKSSAAGSRLASAANIAALNHPWSHDVKKRLIRNFRLTGFRAHQLESINATLAGKDVFVLMPTGGGKSLCYQLPAQVQTGKTRGITIVISPLISLMEDQVAHLKELGIQAFFLNGSTTAEQKSMVRNVLRNEQNPEDFISLLYVTPEMMSKNVSMVDIFTQLCRRQRLARIVIDEAHCVSQWGHDFRPDYTQLGSLREKFPGVPFMALTATATENVKMDVVHQLHMKGCEMFKQSFNRPNLYYEVLAKKPKSITADIANLINDKFKNKCGIVYCLARASCESLAAALKTKHGIAAHHYHAGLSTEERAQIQRAWQSGQYTVIVATIAFGMGIDKPDVRFVIHHSIPKSLEGYYQETGRAGRDGQRSWCYLFWSGADFPKYRKMILESDGSREQQQRQLDMLKVVSQFVENKSDCRRQQVLLYFNENFDSSNCHKACDNCNSTASFETQDFSSYAHQAIAIVRAYWKDTNPRAEEGGLTFGKLLDHFFGKKRLPSRTGNEVPHYSAGSDLDREDCERLVWKLLMIGALQEKNEPNRGGFPQAYIIPGNQARDYERHGTLKVELEIRTDRTPKPKKRTKGTSKSKKQHQREYLDTDNLGPSTILTSPIQPQSKRARGRKKSSDADLDDVELRTDGYEHDGFVISDDDDDDYFEDVKSPPRSPSPKIRAQRAAVQNRGRAVSTDRAKMNQPLSPMRKMLAEGLQEELSKFCRHNLVVHFGLRAQPFSDSVLQSMAVRLPASLEEMMEIPNINPDMVTRYGDKLLRMIRSSVQSYKSMKEIPHDPNHDIHIDLTAEAEDSEEEYAFSDDDDEDLGDEKSHHFEPQDSSAGAHESTSQDAKSRDVESFNAKWRASTQSAQPGASTSLVPPPAPTAGKPLMPFKTKGKFNQHKQRGSGVVYRRRNASGGSKSGTKSRAPPAKATGRASGPGAAGRPGSGGIRAMIG